jgi:hypothetical protein
MVTRFPTAADFKGRNEKKQIITLILAVIAFLSCILINISPPISMVYSNAKSVTTMIDLRPMWAELVILAIIFGLLFMKFKSPNKKG